MKKVLSVRQRLVAHVQELERVIEIKDMPFDLDDHAVDLLVTLTRGCSPSLLRQLMEGMKRTLVLAPRLHLDVSNPAKVLGHVVASIAPPPEMSEPPLWADRDRALVKLEGMPWPPVRG